MRLFISHATTDLEVAEVLKLRLEEIPDLHCSLLTTDIAPGEDWEQRIRWAAKECDAIACLVTPDYINRPWFYAEWAAFWVQDKSWYLLMLDTLLDDLFEVIRRRESAFLDDRRSVERLLTALAVAGLPKRGIDLLADETVRAVLAARTRVAMSHAEADLARLATRLRAGQDNVSDDLIERLLNAGKREAIVQLARNSSSNGPTKRRQLAVSLIGRGESESAARFDELIVNNAERRTVGIACIDRVATLRDDAALALMMKIYRAVNEPQRRDLRNHASAVGVEVEWPDVDPNR